MIDQTNKINILVSISIILRASIRALVCKGGLHRFFHDHGEYRMTFRDSSRAFPQAFPCKSNSSRICHDERIQGVPRIQA